MYILIERVRRLFGAAWDAEIDRNLLALDLRNELCNRGHRWSMLADGGTPPEEWPCQQCATAWNAAWDSACRIARDALSMTILTAPLWLPYALLAGHPKDGSAP